MFKRKHVIRITSLLIGLLVLSRTSSAQLTSITDFTTAPAIQAGAPAGSYALSGFESVNLYSGLVNVSIPLVKVGGRGEAGYTIQLPIETNWQIRDVPLNGVHRNFPNATQVALSSYFGNNLSLMRYTPGTVIARSSVDGTNGTYACTTGTGAGYSFYLGQTLTRLTYIEADGTEHELRDTLNNGQVAPALSLHDCTHSGINGGESRGTVFATNDGTSATFVADSTIYDQNAISTSTGSMLKQNYVVSGWLLFRNGVRYQLDSSGHVVKIQDRNGNLVQICYAGGGCVTPGDDFTVIDALNRKISVRYANFTTNFTDTITYNGYNSASRTISINWALLGSVLSTGQSVQTYGSLFPTTQGSTSTSFDPYQPGSIVLPDNSSYAFQYNSYGELTRIVLPTLGAYEYDYPSSTSSPPYSSMGSAFVNDPTGGHSIQTVYRRVMQRRTLPNGSTVETRTVYTPTFGLNSGLDSSVQVDTENAAGTILATDTHYFYGDPSNLQSYAQPIFYPGGLDGKEYETDQTAKETGQTAHKVTNTWVPRACSATEVCWSGVLNILHDPNICQANTTLLEATPNLTSGQVSFYDVYNNREELYEFDYGQAPVQSSACPTGVTGYTRRTTTTYLTSGYDTVNTGSPSASIHVRTLPTNQTVSDSGGNVFSRRDYFYDSYSLQDAPGIINQAAGYTTGNTARGNNTRLLEWFTSSADFELQSHFDIAGNVVMAYDGNANPATITYGSPYYAFPSQACKVVTGQNRCVGQTFDLSTGSLLSRTDFNSVMTSLQYNEPLDRMTSATAGSNQTLQTTTTFSYSNSNTVVTSTSDLDASNLQKVISKKILDGMGREIESRQYLDGNPSSTTYVSVQRTYDSMGRAYQVSNPFRASAGESAVWTTTLYDSLSRISSVTTPDTSVTTYTPVNNQITVTDPAAKEKTTFTDALGRLTQVTEDPSGLGYVTTYLYDTVDDLKKVTHQSGLIRTFTYDLLKRLTSATNPESGYIQYTSYDGNGNLLQTTDARTFQTTITYDQLNRVTSKTYSDGVTPSVAYTYDDPSVPFSIGRLTKVNSTGVSISQILGYDALGRPTSSSQFTGSTTYPFSYSFNLAGKLTAETYPSGRTVNTFYDLAGRPTCVSPATTCSSSNYVSAVTYTSHSAIQQMMLGNGLIDQTCFNNRLQPFDIRVGTSATVNCTNSGSDVLNLGFGYGTTNNNGNVQNQTIAIPGSTNTQNYTYDALNRLWTFTETGGQANQTYNYESNGNRWVTGPFIPYTTQTPQSNNFTNNRWAVGSGLVTYDAAGNQLSVSLGAGGTRIFTYDAENRQITASIPAMSAISYLYDGDGKRVQKKVGTTVTTFVYDAQGQLAAEYGGLTNPLAGTTYLTGDHLGSTRLVTNANSIPIQRFDYAPFGEELTQSIDGRGAPYSTNSYPTITPDGTSEKFTGKERDAETGLDFFGARYNSSAQGRFTSPDPIFVTAHRVSDPQQWNLYTYSRNNPLRFTDPTGLDIWLQGCGDESDTCHKGYVGVYNDSGKFDRTHLSGDQTDSASLGTTGVSVNYNGGTYQGVWDTNKNEQNAVTVGGSGALSDLTFTVNGNCGGTCQASGIVNGTNTASGLQSLQFAVTSPGSGFLQNPGFYGADPFHVGRTNFLGYDPNQPQGLAATHLPVPGSVLIDPRTGQPTNVDFHVDQRYPFEDVTGFANHVGSIGHTLFNDVRSVFTGLVDHGGK